MTIVKQQMKSLAYVVVIGIFGSIALIGYAFAGGSGASINIENCNDCNIVVPSGESVSVGSADEGMLGGTRWPSGISADGTSPSSGEVRGTTLTITAASTVAAISPTANDTSDLGAFGLAWNELFVSSTSYLGNVTSTSIEPWANNTSLLGSFGQAWSDVFASGTTYLATTTIVAGDLDVDAGTLLVDESANRVGIASSTPSAQLAVGVGVGTTSTIDVGTACFRMIVDVAGTDTELYYWPCTGTSCPNTGAALAGWATSTASCF